MAIVFGVPFTNARPNLRYWKEGKSPPVEDMNHYEFSATKTQIDQWDKISSSLIEYLSNAHTPGTVAARLYGRSYEDALPTVLFYVDGDTETKLDKTLIPTLISPWHHWIIMPNKQVECAYSKDYIGSSNQSTNLYPGASIGGSKRFGTGTFGGYCILNGEIVALTAGHVLSLDAVEYGYDGNRIIVESVSSQDFRGVRNERVNQLEWAKIDRKKAKNVGVVQSIELQRQMENRAKALLAAWDSITPGQRYTGVVRTCCGEVRCDDDTKAALDWGVFSVVQHRRGANRFPAYGTINSPLGAEFPTTTTQPIAAIWDGEGDLVSRQEVCYVGATNGFTTAFVRSMKTHSVRDVNRKMLYREAWSISVLSNEREGEERPRPGDSGAWVWDLYSGSPIAHLVTSGDDEAQVLVLDDIFTEIEQHTGHRPRLAHTGPDGSAVLDDEG